MSNLRLIELKVSNNNFIVANFTQELDLRINSQNVKISTKIPNIISPQVLKVEVKDNLLLITTQPLSPYIIYTITFSSQNIPFVSKNGIYGLLEDNKNNTFNFLGPENPDDSIREALISYLQNNIYNFDSETLVRTIINSRSSKLLRALYDIKQAKNDNYLSLEIVDELHTRGSGPTDRLKEEGAYQLLRVGLNPTNYILSANLAYSNFPDSPISLLSVTSKNENLIIGNGSPGTFNNLTLTLKKRFVSKLLKIQINYQDGTSYSYNIKNLGYQIQNNRYDQNYAFIFLNLQDNQIKLNDLILEDVNFKLPGVGDFIVVDYEFLSKGKVIDPNSIEISQVLTATREITPPITTKFNLINHLVVTEVDQIATENGVVFLDPNSNPPFSVVHPAFLTELPFKLDSLPRYPGEYSIDYTTGTVFVYGEKENDGTGKYPPVATYNYRFVFTPKLDYTYDETFCEIIASPLRDLKQKNVNVKFNYENTLVPEIDFIPKLHTEVLDERVGNRLISNISLFTQHGPITNVFRIFNETSGEIYKIERWNQSQVFFSSKNSPKILNSYRERAVFKSINNELLIVNQELTGEQARIFKISLATYPIVSASEDSLGSSLNSCVNFSRNDLFVKELYFDNQTASLQQNLARIKIGEYQIDYLHGDIYLGVSNTQVYEVGTVNYNCGIIIPENPHLIGISEIYHSIDAINKSTKKLSYDSFTDGEIISNKLPLSDERFLNQETNQPYVVDNNKIIVTDDIKNVRGIFDHYDLTHNSNPINFVDNIDFTDANIITLNTSGILQKSIQLIETGLTLAIELPSPGIEIASIVSIIRNSDNFSLLGNLSGNVIYLDNTNSPAVGEEVTIFYKINLNSSSTPIVDYNRGDYFIDYVYLADEILISYEYGDNCLDFTQSTAIDQGKNYYVSYKAGALREALLKNFGTLVDLPLLNNNFDINFPRENYRDALIAALHNFTKGPTLLAMKSLISRITHIEPEIIESAFQNWSLGVSYLFPNKINYDENLPLLSAKYNNGVLISGKQKGINFPISSNFKLEEGSLSLWVIPEWDGLDNDATLKVKIQQDGYNLTKEKIYIGSNSIHPSYNLNNEFIINKKEDVIGLPSAIYYATEGIFIYYDIHAKQWKILAKSPNTFNTIYSGSIISSGEVYNVKFIQGLGEINDVVRSYLNKIEFEFNFDTLDSTQPDGYVSDIDGYQQGYSFDGLQFMADEEHYFFDFGRTAETNRFSLFKDGKGYLNFRVKDRGHTSPTHQRNSYQVSTDISKWKAGEKHFVGVSWKLNTSDHRDEMHLYVDGKEVPNLLKYGGRPESSSTDRFRTVKPEIVLSTIPKNTITFNDLSTTFNSTIVFSQSINFSNQSIQIGDSIQIKELGFGTYSIVAVNGNNLILNTPMPASLTAAKFSINPYSVVVNSEVDLYSKIMVSILHQGEETEIPGVKAINPGYELSKNAWNQNVLTLLGYAEAGDQITIRTFGINHRRCREKKYLWNNSSLLKTNLPPPVYLDEVKINKVILPNVVISSDNSSVITSQFHYVQNININSSNIVEGRTLAVRINGNNVNFSTPVNISITGETPLGVVTETITFTQADVKTTVYKFLNITNITTIVTPLLLSKNSISLEIKENYSVTYSEGNDIYAVIKYSYKNQTGSKLSGTINSNLIKDLDNYFHNSLINQTLLILSPLSVAGTYLITEVIDNHTLRVDRNLSSTFSDGSYDIYNTSIGRSGFQNGFFTLQQAGTAATPFILETGWYEFDYSTFLSIPWEPLSDIRAQLGCDMFGNNSANAILDEFLITDIFLDDIRIGEISSQNQSMTTNYQSIKPLKVDHHTLMLLHLDEFPIKNEAEFWVESNFKKYLQSSQSINDYFNKSLIIKDYPLILDNKGLLTPQKEGSIEFWISPRYDTYNDPVTRYYFDASSSTVEKLTSLNSITIKLPGRAAQVLSVIFNGKDYFAGGELANDFQTIKLKTSLPYQQTPVEVNYLPAGLKNNRISIYKNKNGFLVFEVKSNQEKFQIYKPIFWEKDSWHRVMATFKFNRPDHLDQMRLIIDGEENNSVTFGSGLLFGNDLVFGQDYVNSNDGCLTADINFNDPINQLYIGSDYLGANLAQARLENLRLSNIARSPAIVAGQIKDLNYSNNLATVFPVVTDNFTTYLLDFDSLLKKTTDFAIIRNEVFGIFNFTLNIIDSFDIVSSNEKIKEVLETLIYALKPAQSKVTINYLK